MKKREPAPSDSPQRSLEESDQRQRVKEREPAPSDSSVSSPPLNELLLLGLTVALYLVLLQFLPPVGRTPWLRLLLPNLWLLAVTAWRWPPLLSHLLRPPADGCGPLLSAGVAVCAAFSLPLFAWFWPAATAPPFVDALWARWLLVFLVPLAEEVFFRGWLLDHLKGQWGAMVALLLVSLLFAFLHSPQGIFLPMAFLSVVLCALTLFSGSVLWAVVLHLVWNGLSILRTLPPGLERWLVALPAFVVALALVAWGVRSTLKPPRDASEKSPVHDPR